MSSFIETEIQGTHAILLLNRPKALNSLNTEMFKALKKAFQELKSKKTIQNIELRSTSPKAFSAGGDVKSVVEFLLKKEIDKALEFFHEEYSFDEFLWNNSIPVHAHAEGYLMGGGLGIFRPNQTRSISSTTICSMPEGKIGFFADVGATHFLHKLPFPVGLLMALTSEPLDAEACLSFGIATQIENTDQSLDDAPSEWLENLQPLQELFQESHSIETWFETLDHLEDTLGNNSNDFFKRLTQGFQNNSPISLWVMAESLKRSKGLSRKDCFKMESQLAKSFCLFSEDFITGVKARLIDKSIGPQDRPKWTHSSWNQVRASEWEHYFRENS
jgi:enoyl-CoA hydratase/carnithine racemase